MRRIDGYGNSVVADKDVITYPILKESKGGDYMAAAERTLNDMREELIRRFIERTLEMMNIADNLDEFDWEYEAQITNNFKAIQSLKEGGGLDVSYIDSTGV